MAEKAFSREEAIEAMYDGVPEETTELKWISIPGLFTVNKLLQVYISKKKISYELIDALRLWVYPEEDPPEVKGFLKVLDVVCKSMNIKYEISRNIKGEPLSEPYSIRLPFKKLKLHLRIGRGSMDWILKNANKEEPHNSRKIEMLKQELMRESKKWILGRRERLA